MQDRQPGKPGQYKATLTAAEFQKMQAGQQFTITMIRDDQPIVEGTPYSKAAVLPDAVAAAICPGVGNPTPADAFRALHVSKAPASFGLGEQTANYPVLGDANDALLSGLYKIGTDTKNGVGAFATLEVIAYANNFVVQRGYRVSTGITQERWKLNGEWTEWARCDAAAFAPSGYGVGGNSKSLSSFAELDTLMVGGKYFVNAGSDGKVTINGYNIQYANVDVIGIGASNVIQRMNPHRTGYWLQRNVYYDGTCGEWEWENPPMLPGVEQPTTERHGGAVVYRKRLMVWGNVIGTGNGISTVSFAHNISNLAEVVDIIGFADEHQLPYMSTNGGLTFTSEVDANNVHVRVKDTSWPTQNWYFDISYTKTANM